MKRNTRVSTAVIRRLPRYYRQLSELQRKGVICSVSAALVSRAMAIRWTA